MYLLAVFLIMNDQCTVMNHSKQIHRLSRLQHLSYKLWLYKTCKTFNYWQELQSGILTDTIQQELHLYSVKKKTGSASQCMWQVCQAGCEIMGDLNLMFPICSEGDGAEWKEKERVNSLCELEQTIARRTGMPLPYTGIWVMQCRTVSSWQSTGNSKRTDFWEVNLCL